MTSLSIDFITHIVTHVSFEQHHNVPPGEVNLAITLVMVVPKPSLCMYTYSTYIFSLQFSPPRRGWAGQLPKYWEGFQWIVTSHISLANTHCNFHPHGGWGDDDFEPDVDFRYSKFVRTGRLNYMGCQLTVFVYNNLTWNFDIETWYDLPASK